jgi:hypothetical protein
MSRSLCALALLLALVPSQGGKPTLTFPADFLKRQEITPTKQFGIGWVDGSFPTLMAGCALAMAMVLAGLLLLRRSSARLVTGSAACVLGLLLFVNSSCSPRPPPDDHWLHKDRVGGGPSYREVRGPNTMPDGSLQGEVLLEEGKPGDPIRLAIDEGTLKAFADHHTAKAKD